MFETKDKRLRINKSFLFMGSALALCLVIGLYVLYWQEKEEADHVFRTRVISITSDDQVYFGRDRVNMDDLINKTSELIAQEGSRKMLYVSPEENVQLSSVYPLIELVQGAGHYNVGLVTETSRSPYSSSIEAAIRVTVTPCVDLHTPIVSIQGNAPGTQTLQLNGVRMEAGELVTNLQRELGEKSDKSVSLKANKSIKYEELKAVLNQIRTAGISRMDLETGECQ
jgi:biopolymer transport protein ExbD